MEAGQVTISLYENSVPSFVEAELEILHPHVFSSMVHFRVYGGLNGNTHTYVAQEQGKTSALLLFRIEGNKVEVLNEQISLSPEEIERFCRHVFEAWPSVDLLTFRAVAYEHRPLAYPSQQFYRTEDIVLQLPRTADEYLAKLGKATRKNFKYHGNRLKRNFPTLGYQVHIDHEIVDQHVRDIIELNRARMSAKNKSSDIDAAETERLIRLVKQSGMVATMMLDGRIVAGIICSRIGANYFMHINAHAPAYDDARLGKLCCYMTICNCIERGGKEFHFMWGRFEYKYLLGGVQQNFNELVVYRSPERMLRHWNTVLRVAYQGYSREWKFKILDMADSKGETGAIARAAIRFLNFLRHFRRSGFRLTMFIQAVERAIAHKGASVTPRSAAVREPR